MATSSSILGNGRHDSDTKVHSVQARRTRYLSRTSSREKGRCAADPHLVMVARHADAAHVLPHDVQQALVGHRADASLPLLVPSAVPGHKRLHRPRLKTLGGGGMRLSPLGSCVRCSAAEIDGSHIKIDVSHRTTLLGTPCKRRNRR